MPRTRAKLQQSSAPVILPPPEVELHLLLANGKQQQFNFTFYQSTHIDPQLAENQGSRYVCLCNNVGCVDIFGEGWGWENALHALLSKMQTAGVIQK